MDQTIMPKDPRTLFQPLFGWTFEPLEDVDYHPPWIVGGDPRRRGNLTHAENFDQHPPWIMVGDPNKRGDPLHAEDVTEAYDDRVYICRIFCAYVNFRLKNNPFLVTSDEHESPEKKLSEFMKLDSKWPDVWDHMTQCLRYCLVSISNQERQAIFELLLNTHLWCMEERQSCYRPEFALITSFQNSFLWAIPYRDTYRKVNHGLSELEELYESVPVRDFMSVFYGHNREGMQDLCEAMIDGCDPKKTGDSCVYAWDKSGDIKEPDFCSCADMLESVYILRSDISRKNLEVNKRLHHELGILLGRGKM